MANPKITRMGGKTTKKKEEFPGISIMPPKKHHSLKQDITKLAVADGRSVNEVIVKILTDYVDAPYKLDFSK